MAAAFEVAPQQFLMNASKEAMQAIRETPLGAFIGSIFAATPARDGSSPQYGQLAQGSMQPHVDYMRSRAPPACP